MGHQGHAIFGRKLLNTQHDVGRCARKLPIMKRANALKGSSEKSLKPKAASHNNASWCTDTDGSLEHSPSGGSLCYKGPTFQKRILGFLELPLIYPGGKKVYIHMKTCIGMFTADFFVTAKKWKQSKCVYQHMTKQTICGTHIIEYYLA